MDLKDVLTRFALVSGFDSRKISKFTPLILDCMSWFKEKMAGEYTAAQKKRLCYACAVYAYYKISLCSGDEELSSFKAGDVQFSTASSKSRAKTLWENERGEISSLIDLGDETTFLGVRV